MLSHIRNGVIHRLPEGGAHANGGRNKNKVNHKGIVVLIKV